MAPTDHPPIFGQIGNEMYFVHRGEFDVLVGTPPVIVAKLRQGNFFGEALIVSKPRAATVQAPRSLPRPLRTSSAHQFTPCVAATS